MISLPKPCFLGRILGSNSHLKKTCQKKCGKIVDVYDIHIRFMIYQLINAGFFHILTPSSTASITFTPRPLFSSMVPLQILQLVVPQLKRQGTDINQTNVNGYMSIYIYICVCVCLCACEYDNSVKYECNKFL